MGSALIALLRQWLASNRSTLYALAAALLIAYLFYRPPPPNVGAQAACPGRGRAKARPRVTISTAPGVVFAPGAGTTFELAAGACDALRRLAAFADVYLITPNVTLDSHEAELRAALAREGVFDFPGFDARKVLVCSTAVGRTAMCRQIEPALHIDSASDIVEGLAPHVPHVALISAAPGQRAPGRDNVLSASSLGELVDLYADSMSFS